jgi:hypothetical protein
LKNNKHWYSHTIVQVALQQASSLAPIQRPPYRLRRPYRGAIWPLDGGQAASLLLRPPYRLRRPYWPASSAAGYVRIRQDVFRIRHRLRRPYWPCDITAHCLLTSDVCWPWCWRMLACA